MKANSVGERFYCVMEADQDCPKYKRIGDAKLIANDLAKENPGKEYVVLIADISYQSGQTVIKQLR